MPHGPVLPAVVVAARAVAPVASPTRAVRAITVPFVSVLASSTEKCTVRLAPAASCPRFHTTSWSWTQLPAVPPSDTAKHEKPDWRSAGTGIRTSTSAASVPSNRS
jgi:hypothetical protein